MKTVFEIDIDDYFSVDDEIDELLELDGDSVIVIDNMYDFFDENKYIEKLLPLLQRLQDSGKKYNVEIKILNLELLKKSGLLNLSNINFLINNYFDTRYTKDEFLKVDEKLEELIKPIREAKLSPYERFLAVYEIIKSYKPYKEYEFNRNGYDLEISRRLGNILFNEYIVCNGFVNFLTALCNKLDIPVAHVSLSTRDVANDSRGMHGRNIIKLDDEKYNIHGIYLSDATWDNDIGLELYNNSAITFDRKKEADWMESLEDVDLLFDFHDMNDFNSKINFLLKRNNKKDSINDIESAYFDICEKILKLLLNLDYDKYLYFFNKYYNLIEKLHNEFFWDKIPFSSIEKVYVDFFTEYAQYIIPLSNKEISNSTMLDALSEIKKQTKKYSLEQLKEFREKVINDSKEVADYAFPYIYDPNNPRLNYLDSREEVEKGLSK